MVHCHVTFLPNHDTTSHALPASIPVRFRYNDHHFQYGYYIYACAALGKGDSAWLAQYSRPILDLVRDYANPNTEDPYFPFARNKDWFLGHSWAGGLFTFEEGKNQVEDEFRC